MIKEQSIYKVNLKTYWLDFIISLVIFFITFIITFITGNIISFIISSIFLYRTCAFTHEIAHQDNNKDLRNFKFCWNLIGGLLILQPSTRFTKPHLAHHTTGIFGTDKDPQYPLIFSDVKLAIIIFLILPFVLPIYNFLVCLSPKRNSKLERLLYKNIEFNEYDYMCIDPYETYYVIIWTILLVFTPSLVLNFYVVSVGAWLLSILRIPLEHSLTSYKKTSTYNDQIKDSYTHESPIYIPIQPLSLRYHKAHHMYAKVPYHNLPNLHYELKRTGKYDID